ncbi:host attachment family protein [Rhizobium halophytocola]|uniref:Protein required for attachment to host cells n=1 Tax=Rhizobium halophytocola TaxID=735519 RepID=A0ABS4DYU3_9HYPH|nr:host attachment family protein [Rhizobium halophytocola]MBP1850857.1 protein required for attachment to host cells [Rhizobium halophytocola]
MGKYDVSWKSWVIVADGTKALIMRNEGDKELMNLQIVEHVDQPAEADRDLSADKPGRTHQSHGSGRSAMEETDFHQQAEDDFLKRVASMLDDKVYARDIEQFILVAPPKALGTLRSALKQTTLDAMTADVAKDLVKLTVPDIEKHLKALH